MKLWNKEDVLNKKVEEFTVGDDRNSDMFLAKYDIIASIAHAKMLSETKIISKNESQLLIKELKSIKNKILKNEFRIEEQFEDIHSKLEFILTERLGEVGKKIHTGRSRNDQVLVATQLYLKDEILIIKELIKNLFDTLIMLANKNKNKLLPGYTHLQVAMPSSFGIWFSAYAESLIDDILYLNTAYKINNQNPLGSAAGYGSSFNIDRNFTTKELGFETLKYNVVSAQMNRGKVEKSVAIAIESVAETLSKFCSDICFYMTTELNFISFPNDLITGSSIMPHKKNPDLFELIRAKCNVIKSLSNEFNIISTNMTSGYHRDMQLYKSKIIDAIETIKNCLEIFSSSIKKIEIKNDILNKNNYKYIFSVDNLNSLMIEKGLSFRDAYNEISKSIKKKSYKPKKRVKQTLVGGIDNLCLEQIKKKMNQNF
jgi:argininosuccinate lyase